MGRIGLCLAFLSLVSKPRLTMDQFELKYFNICRIHLLIFGQWPYQSKLTIVPARIIISTLLISFGCEKAWRLIKLGNNMQIFIEDIPYFCMWLLMAGMFACGVLQLDLLKGLLERIKHDWQCAMLNKEDHILESITKRGWKHTIYLLSLTYIMTTFYSIFQFAPDVLGDKIPWNTTHRRQPFIGAFLLDPDKDYPLRLPYSSLIVAWTAIGTSAAVAQFHMLISHACGMFSIFGHRLEHVFHDNSENCIKDNRLHTDFVRIIEQHWQIVEYIDTLKSYYALFCCFVGFCGVLSISSLLVNVCLYIRNGSKIELAVLTLLNIFGIFFNTYISCASAQQLLNTSSDVFRQTYCGEWYTASISNQKILLIIMCNCIQPTAIALSSIFTVSLETFYVLLKTAMSYFTLLYSLQ